ncbi:hypothetical protein [Rugamonas sp.]|uniref:hypothetical protein n=1 Tax=Rugamonas sp. TaxID=1926287 RepID=UPI0025D543AC|nr:hypothetical protein [Rugamonas sp.]
MTPAPSFDASIPVLTEVLKDEPAPDAPAHDHPATAPVPAAAVAPAPADPAAQLEAAAVSDWSESQWALLEHRLSDRILHQLQGRVDFVLEQRVKDSMEAIVNGALHELTREIRSGLHDTIQKIVARAVAQELTHLQAQKK